MPSSIYANLCGRVTLSTEYFWCVWFEARDGVCRGWSVIFATNVTSICISIDRPNRAFFVSIIWLILFFAWSNYQRIQARIWVPPRYVHSPSVIDIIQTEYSVYSSSLFSAFFPVMVLIRQNVASHFMGMTEFSTKHCRIESKIKINKISAMILLIDLGPVLKCRNQTLMKNEFWSRVKCVCFRKRIPMQILLPTLPIFGQRARICRCLQHRK